MLKINARLRIYTYIDLQKESLLNNLQHLAAFSNIGRFRTFWTSKIILPSFAPF